MLPLGLVWICRVHYSTLWKLNWRLLPVDLSSYPVLSVGIASIKLLAWWLTYLVRALVCFRFCALLVPMLVVVQAPSFAHYSRTLAHSCRVHSCCYWQGHTVVIFFHRGFWALYSGALIVKAAGRGEEGIGHPLEDGQRQTDPKSQHTIQKPSMHVSVLLITLFFRPLGGVILACFKHNWHQQYL